MIYKSDEDFFRIGFIRKPHGVIGFVSVEALTDFPERRFFVGAKILVLQHGRLEELLLAEIKHFKAGFLLRFSGFESREQAESLRSCYLCLPLSEREELDDNNFYIDQLLGLQVFDFYGQRVGNVIDFEVLPANAVLTIRGDSGIYNGDTFLLPFVKAAVADVQLPDKKLQLAEGWVLCR